MISEKKEREEASSSCSKTVVQDKVSAIAYSSSVEGYTRFWCSSHNARCRMSASLIVPFELAYINQLQLVGWNSAAVITSVSSSMLAGLISTILKLWSWILRFQRLTLRSSLLMKVSPSLFTEILFMWYAWALAYVLRGTAATTVSWCVIRGSFSAEGSLNDKRGGRGAPPPPTAPAGVSSLERLFSATTFSDLSNTFHNFIVLSFVERRKWEAFCRLHHFILLIFSSISNDFK